MFLDEIASKVGTKIENTYQKVQENWEVISEYTQGKLRHGSHHISAFRWKEIPIFQIIMFKVPVSFISLHSLKLTAKNPQNGGFQ